jgi:2-polyprenyl-3-methyl-5-hydroxy-6-metoxy-1,4-benzoquinol methylase
MESRERQPDADAVDWPSRSDLENLFLRKYGRPEDVGWGPSRRHRHGYHTPADVYEALVANVVRKGCRWVDIGGGHQVFPDNPELARALISRCSRVVAVDPSPNVLDNEFAHERVQSLIEDYQPDDAFDLATMRMVAEHVTRPEQVVGALSRLLRPKGIVIVFTVSLWSPVTLVSRLTPHRLHHPIKERIWGTSEADTFPVAYQMNTRRRLLRLLRAQGFRELAFAHLDDLSMTARSRTLNAIEFTVWRLLRRIGLRYPEHCLLGVYQKGEPEP